MLELDERISYYKIIQTGRLAEKLGADILGLGAFTSVVGDGGVTVAKSLKIPVTTGDAYTIAVAIQAVRKAATLMEIDLANTAAAIVGATGAIGKVCAQLLANDVPELYLIGRNETKLRELQNLLEPNSTAKLIVETDIAALRNSKVVLTVSSAVDAIIRPDFLQPGSVICDVARPRDVAANVAAQRQDVLVIDGGVVDVPGTVNFNFDFGFPPGKAYACMAETIALALEGRFEDYTLGKDISSQRVEEIAQIAAKHGFELSGFRSFEHPVTPKQIEQTKKKAKLRSLSDKT